MRGSNAWCISFSIQSGFWELVFTVPSSGWFIALIMCCRFPNMSKFVKARHIQYPLVYDLSGKKSRSLWQWVLTRQIFFTFIRRYGIIPLAKAIRAVIVTADKGVEEEVNIPLKQWKKKKLAFWKAAVSAAAEVSGAMSTDMYQVVDGVALRETASVGSYQWGFIMKAQKCLRAACPHLE